MPASADNSVHRGSFSVSLGHVRQAAWAVALGLSAFSCSSLPASASPTDILSIGDAQISLSGTDIGLSPHSGSVGASSTGAFAGSSGIGVALKNLNGLSPGAVSVFNFLFVNSMPNASFKLTNINPGVFGSGTCGVAPAAGQSCTPPGSPFNLVNTVAGTTVSFSASGIVTNSLTGQESAFSGTFSTEFAGQSYQDVLAKLAGGGLDTASFSASINVPSGSLAGTLNIGKPTLTLSANSIVFAPSVSTGPSTGIFNPDSFTGAEIKSLGAGAAPIPNFVILDAAPNLSILFEDLAGGDFSAAACGDAPALGQTCTPPGSEFSLMNVQTGSVLSMSFDALLVNGATGTTSPLAGLLTTEFSFSYQDLLAGLANGGAYSASYSLQFATPENLKPSDPAAVPEPFSLAIFAAGVLGLGALRRDRKRQPSRA